MLGGMKSMVKCLGLRQPASATHHMGFLALLAVATIAATNTQIVVGGQKFDVGRPVVLWDDPERGFDGYAESCLEDSAKAKSPCCQRQFKRFGKRSGMKGRSLQELQGVVKQFVLHHDGCVNSRSCFYSMHDMPRPDGGCGLSAHFMVDADGTIYQTLDLVERAYHAEQANTISVGVEICNRADASRNELSRLPPDYRTRPVRDVLINGHVHKAFDYRPEQYRSIIALSRAIIRVFPRIGPVIPLGPTGEPSLDTLEKPSAFEGIVGHLHVDEGRQKWDPGAFDWKKLMSALTGYYLPLQVAGYTRFPFDNEPAINRTARVAFESAEERSSGFYPVSPAGLQHSGLNFRGSPGASVRAPMRGTIVAARFARHGLSSTSFVLIKHDLQTPAGAITFFSMLSHLQPEVLQNPETSGVPWLETLAREHNRRVLTTLKFGDVTLMGASVESGEIVGKVGFVKRGAEVGPEVRFEIFSADRLAIDTHHFFKHSSGVSDGAWMRRGMVLDLLTRTNAATLSQTQLAQFFRSENLDARQTLRRMVIRHAHEWGDRQTFAEFSNSPELRGQDVEAKRRVFKEAIEPYVFWSDALSSHAGLPADQVIYSYNPITFLAVLAAAQANARLRWPAADAADRDAPGVPQTADALAVWTTPPALIPLETPIFGPLAPLAVVPRKRSEIPLIELPALEGGGL